MKNTQIPGLEAVDRRHRVDLMSSAETAILAAQHAVERAGASRRLTIAGTLLEQARLLVADHAESDGAVAQVPGPGNC